MDFYKEMVTTILEKGEKVSNRTGIDTIKYFGYFYKIQVDKERIPILTTKKIMFSSIIHELLWLLSGENHIRNLRKKTKIWDAWANEDGELETAYGRFWRHYPGVPWQNHVVGERLCPPGETFDQIEYVINSLKEIKSDPSHSSGRRLIVTAWHPHNATVSKLPPCHYTFCLNVTGNKLNLHLTQRSGDVFLGIPFNLTSYCTLLRMFCELTGFESGEFAHTIIDAHIYENHLPQIKEQMKRECFELPILKINHRDIIDDFKFEDFELLNYKHHGFLKGEVAV